MKMDLNFPTKRQRLSDWVIKLLYEYLVKTEQNTITCAQGDLSKDIQHNY